MPAISSADGPVAVTGASGYIGSWVVRDLVNQGYVVRACVRDLKNPAKVDHLLVMNSDRKLRGKVELFRADLTEPGSYDVPFRGCCAVIHCGAALGFNKETPQQVYDQCFTENKHVLESAKKAGGTVKRFVFTSSFAAVHHPRPSGYVYTEKDWCGDNVEAYNGEWTTDNIPKIQPIAYAMAKSNSEKFLYEQAQQDGSFEAIAIMPTLVVGPLLCQNHDQKMSWQNVLMRIAAGKPYRTRGASMHWNLVDVRDVARAHRLCAESTTVSNGSRYILGANDRNGEMSTWELQEKIRSLFSGLLLVNPEWEIPEKKVIENLRTYCLLAKQELGLQPYAADETIRETVFSYMRLGLLKAGSKL